MTKHTYYMMIDGGDGGEDTVEAETIEEAVAAATDWCAEGDWGYVQEGTEEQYDGCGECDILVWREDDDGNVIERETTTWTIPTLGDLQEAELDGEVLAERVYEWSTERLVRVGDGWVSRPRRCPVEGCGQTLVRYKAGYLPGYRVCMARIDGDDYDPETLRHRFVLDHHRHDDDDAVILIRDHCCERRI